MRGKLIDAAWMPETSGFRKKTRPHCDSTGDDAVGYLADMEKPCPATMNLLRILPRSYGDGRVYSGGMVAILPGYLGVGGTSIGGRSTGKPHANVPQAASLRKPRSRGLQ